MPTKLTLSLDSKVIELAKKYAEKKGISLSKLVEEYFDKITKPQLTKTQKSLDDLKGLLGQIPEDFDYRKAKADYLFEKHIKR